MEKQEDAVIVLPKSDLKKIDKAIASVFGELNVKPTRVAFVGDQVKICYRPWYKQVFLEAFQKAS